jgi:hypothetical protein
MTDRTAARLRGRALFDPIGIERVRRSAPLPDGSGAIAGDESRSPREPKDSHGPANAALPIVVLPDDPAEHSQRNLPRACARHGARDRQHFLPQAAVRCAAPSPYFVTE